MSGGDNDSSGKQRVTSQKELVAGLYGGTNLQGHPVKKLQPETIIGKKFKTREERSVSTTGVAVD